MSASANEPPKLKKRLLSLKQQQLHNFALGQSAEQQAIGFLLSHNFQILKRNVRVNNHEVDIIAIDVSSNELVFVEVKSRSTGWFGNPSLAVNQHKLRSMRYVAGAYRRQHKHTGDFRFDSIAITNSSIEHFRNITWNHAR